MLKRTCISVTFFSSLMLFFPPRLTAQELQAASKFAQEMETDRPDFTEGTQAVAPDSLQLEAGYTFSKASSSTEDTRSHSIPEALLRVGLAPTLELRLAWEGYIREDASQRSEEVSDLVIGFKQSVIDESEQLPALSYILELQLPTGSDAVRVRDPAPGIKILWAKSLTEEISLAGNLNYALAYEDRERLFELASSLALGISLSENAGAYFEYFGIFPHTSGVTASLPEQHYVNGGLTYAATDTLQLDARIGAGLNSAADDLFAGFGFAWRHALSQ